MTAPIVPQPHAEKAQKPKARKWPLFVGGAALVVGIIIAAAGASGGATPSNTAASAPAAKTVTVTVTVPPRTITRTVHDPAPAAKTIIKTVTAAPPAPPAAMSTDGTYVVGSDVKPGTYHTAGMAAGGPGECYWARLKDTSGNGDSIIANNGGTGPTTVTISSSDGAFQTTGCQAWTPVK